MDTYAHSLPGRDRSEWELLADHLAEVGRLAASHADVFGAGPIARAAGLLHDIGKCSAEFQRYIAGQGSSPDHSTAGARLAVERYGDRLGKLLAFAIAGHHAGLPDGDDSGESATLPARLRKAVPSYAGWERHAPTLPNLAEVASAKLPRYGKDERGFSLTFFTRMLFSALVDADRLATERFYVEAEGGRVERGEFQPLEVLVERLDTHLAKLARGAEPTELNRLRSEILERARAIAAAPPGPFTLTVPTGGGKTLASLAFALAHARKNGLRRVIYVIPYTSIIEQTAGVFKQALGDDQVLEHHSALDWDAALDAKGDDEGREGLRKLRNASENWDAPVIVTTAVQFFESMFTDRPSRARKLHKVAASVVVLDEVQTVPVPLLLPCMAALQELARNYRVSVVLCTATQPALRTSDGFEGGFESGEDREIAPDPSRLYEILLRRVRVERLPDRVGDEEVAARFAETPRMLCILNTRKHARELFERIRGLEGARHLSTLMCPLHRRAELKRIREDLKEKRPVRLVATSLIEAGVDVDFPEVWRAETGLDSVAQAAGRCNREGRMAEPGRVVVFTPADAEPHPAFEQNASALRTALRAHGGDPLGLSAVHAYFKELYFTKGRDQLDAHKILACIRERADAFDFPFRWLGSTFRVIEETMAPVIVPWRPEGDSGVDGLLRELEWVDRPGRIARRLAQYTVPVPARVRAQLLSTGAARVVRPEFGDRFVWLENADLYTPELGLDWSNPYFRSAESSIL